MLRFAFASVLLLFAAPTLVVGQELRQDKPIDPTEFAFRMLESSPAETIPTAGPELLTLADLEAIAFENNPTLAAVRARMDSARGRQVQAGLYPNPVMGYHGTEIGNLGTAGQQGAFVSQRFITGGKLRLDQAIAGQEIKEASFKVVAQQQRVLSDVRVRFYDVRVAEQRVELTHEIVRIGDDFVEATQQLVAGRVGTENDLLQAEIKADESRILHDNARNAYVEAWRRLCAVVGVPNMPMMPLSGALESDLPNLDWDRCLAAVLDNNPDLNVAKTRVDRARIVIRRARKEPIPDVDLWVSVRRNNITQSDVANVQVGIPIPVLDNNRGNIRSAQAELAAACNEVKRIELALQDQLAAVFRRYANARQQADRYREQMVPRAERSLSLVRDGYSQGQVEYLTLLNAQQTFLQVNLSYLAALQELRTTASVISGQLLADSIGEQR